LDEPPAVQNELPVLPEPEPSFEFTPEPPAVAAEPSPFEGTAPEPPAVVEVAAPAEQVVVAETKVEAPQAVAPPPPPPVVQRPAPVREAPVREARNGAPRPAAPIRTEAGTINLTKSGASAPSLVDGQRGPKVLGKIDLRAKPPVARPSGPPPRPG